MLEAVSVQDSSATGSWKSWLNPQRDCNMPKIPFYKPSIGAGEIDEVIVALPEEDPVRLREIREMLKSLPVKVTFVSGRPGLG